MNKLQLRAARFRTASTFHHRKAPHDLSRVHHAVSAVTLHHDAAARRAMPLRAQWFRNPASGLLECRWIAETTTEPPMHRNVVIRSAGIRDVFRMNRRFHRAGMRPPSR